MSKIQLTDGSEVPEDGSHNEDRGDGQNKGYVVLSPEERAKGFVRPVRNSYIHIGKVRKYPVREMSDEEKANFADQKWEFYEEYPKGEHGSALGRYWTRKELQGCNARTTMGNALAETYARDPKFYGATFCCACSTHFPVEEFVWDGTNEQVGS